jgi:pyruvate dehydrogenase E2 component (dihydrolipoamide acetyltransferase)
MSGSTSERTLVEPTLLRRAIARRMSDSKRDAPHFYIEVEVATSEAQLHVERLEAQSGERVTMTALLVRATALALRAHPRLNALWTKRGLEHVAPVHVGVAVSLDDGLVAPALLNAHELTVLDTARALGDLVDRARSGKLRPAEMTEATFTLSNLGMFAVSRFTAIITPPQVAVLATGSSQIVPRYANGDLRPTPVMSATVSADHRAVDGTDVARFLGTFKDLLEAPRALDG